MIAARTISEGTVSERIDSHGRILWLPGLAADTAVAYRAIVERMLAGRTGAIDAPP